MNMSFHLQQPIGRSGRCCGLIGLLWLGLLLLPHATPLVHAKTAYLVASMEQPYVQSNDSFNNLRAILQQLDAYDSIVLTEDYAITNPQEEYLRSDPVKVPHNLTITSFGQQRYQLSFNFVVNAMFMNNHSIILRQLALNTARKSSGQSLPFFEGAGVLVLEDVVRVRLACSPLINVTVATLRDTPRPPDRPGQQLISVQDYYFRGKVYQNAVHADDLALFVSPADVEGAAYYAGYSVLQYNVTRVCERYVAASCNEQCLQQTMEAIVAAQAQTTVPGSNNQLVTAVVPPVVIGSVLLMAAAAAIFWHRRRHQRRHKQQQKAAAAETLLQHQNFHQGQQKLRHLENGSMDSAMARDMPGRSGSGRSPARNAPAAGWQAHVHGGNVPQGLLSDPSDVGTVSSPGKVAEVGPAAVGQNKGWQLMACHSAPEFTEADAKDTITLGVLLGAGSFGRVYRGRWRGLDVAVKVMHHDVSTAASVANEVDLVMSFRHPNITTAYHFLTWNFTHDNNDEHTVSASTHTFGQTAALQQQQHQQQPPPPAAAEASTAATPTPSSVVPLVKPVIVGPVTVPGSTTAAATAAAAAASSAASSSVSDVLHTSHSALITRQNSAGSSVSKAVTRGSAARHAPVYASVPAQSSLDTAAPQQPSTTAATATQVHRSTGSNTGAAVSPFASRAGSSGSHAFGTFLISSTPSTLVPPNLDASRFMPVLGSHAWSGRLNSDWGSATTGGTTLSSAVGPAVELLPVSVHKQQLQQQQRADSMLLQPHTPARQQPQLQASQLPLEQQVQQQQHQQQQQFVPMVRYPAPSEEQEQQSQPLQQYVPYLHPPQLQDQGQQQPLAPDSASPGHALPSQPPSQQEQQLLPGVQQQHQQHQGVARTSSGFSGSWKSSSHAGRNRAGGRGQFGEAQTWLILEFCDGGTLLDVMQEERLVSQNTGKVNIAHILSLLSDVAAGMGYLHSRNCVHGDLKPANVLLKQQPGAPFGHIAKVSDFGLTRSLTAGQSHRSTKTLGTFNRAPPELLRLGRLSPACDVYAFGIMMWELYTGHVAFSGTHYGEVFERVALLQQRPEIPPDMPSSFCDLMCACWGADPFVRPTFDVIQQQLGAILKQLPDGHERFVSDL